ncbi:MAG: hypothetical protein KAG18_08130, partial [Sinobacterium sp.]|nr:hypothetical protein [Sinobacterium sp.]
MPIVKNAYYTLCIRLKIIAAMIERLPVSKKLELLVLIPMLAFSLVLAQFSYVKYQDFQALRLLQQQYTLFQTFDSVNKSLEALRLHISLGEFHNVDDDKIQLQAIVAHLESTSSWLNKTGTQQYFTSLIGDLNFILETDTNELLPSEWGEIIKEAISSIYQLSVKIPVSVRHETLRSDNEKYLLLQKLQNNVADELNYFVLLLANNIELNKQDLDTFSFQQQNIIDVYLNRYASENEIQKLLEAFNHQSFENVVQLRLDIVERHSKGALALSNKEINIIDQRSKRIYAVIISVRKTILSEIEKDIAASVQLIFLNAFLLLAVIVLVLHFSLKIRQRIIGSLAFIGATLQKIERSKDYTIDITIEGADEFSQLSSTLGVLIQQRAVSEFDMIAAKNSAEQANSAKSVFLANMSHEIRTPLNGILGMSDILQKTDMSLSQKSHLKTIQSSSKSLLSLINDILDFSKIESNSLNITKSESNLYFVLDNVVSIIAPKLQSGNVELTLDYPLNVNTVFLMDDYRVQQIILNLVSNAVKFSPEGHVCITVALEKVKDGRRDYNELSVSIRDTGIGMSKEQLSAVFEPFKQVDDSITRKYQGTGLGLTISNHLTQLMGGRLEAKSALGEGSTFTLLLPVEIIADNYLSEEDTSVKDAGLSRLKNKPEYWLQGINVVLLSDDATKQLQTQTYLQEVGAS